MTGCRHNPIWTEGDSLMTSPPDNQGGGKRASPDVGFCSAQLPRGTSITAVYRVLESNASHLDNRCCFGFEADGGAVQPLDGHMDVGAERSLVAELMREGRVTQLKSLRGILQRSSEAAGS